MYQALYFDEVYTDIQEAKAWYQKQQEGLELRFASCIEEAIIKIIKNPKVYSIRYKQVRIAHPKTFPYNIHFYVDDNAKTIVFIGIVFNKRNDALNLSRHL